MAGKPWVKGGPSPNPTGRPKTAEAFKERARNLVDKLIIDAWEEELTVMDRVVDTPDGPIKVRQRGPNWVKCSELATAYAYGKPSQSIDVSVTHSVQEMDDARLLEIINAEPKPAEVMQ